MFSLHKRSLIYAHSGLISDGIQSKYIGKAILGAKNQRLTFDLFENVVKNPTPHPPHQLKNKKKTW